MDVYGIKYNCVNKLGIRITINELNHPQSFLVLLRVALYICSQKGLLVEFVVEQRTSKGRTTTNKENSGSLPPGGGGWYFLTYKGACRWIGYGFWALGPQYVYCQDFSGTPIANIGQVPPPPLPGGALTCLVNILPYSAELGSRIVRLG